MDLPEMHSDNRRRKMTKLADLTKEELVDLCIVLKEQFDQSCRNFDESNRLLDIMIKHCAPDMGRLH